MHLPAKRQRWLLIALIHLWWLLLSGGYLLHLWRGPALSGIDASGHVAALHLYAAHTYPDIQGQLPEFFGGMPFPVFYPPLFYWVGATLMRLCSIDATLAAKLITIASFAALPGVLFGLGRRLGLNSSEAATASALAGVIVCGSNFASHFAVGLPALFEVGLYTHTLGFLWLCLWCGSLPHARRSRKAALVATASLSALILTNVHVLPVGVIYGVCWLVLDGCRTWRQPVQNRTARVLSNSLKTTFIVLKSVMVAGLWLMPLVTWHHYAVGQDRHLEWLFSALNILNLLWVPCVLVAVIDRRRRPALAALCITLLLTLGASLSTFSGALVIPFQPWRLASTAIPLATIPAALLCAKLLREILKSKLYSGFCIATTLFVLVWLHPPAGFDTAALSVREAEDVRSMRAALKGLPAGMVVVEAIWLEESDTPFPATATARDQAASRALAHQLAMDGRPVSWSIFREHAVSAPLATAVRNLFSTTPEKFGIDGLALQRASDGGVGTAEALRLARHLGGAYWLVKSPTQVSRLKGSPDVRFLVEIGGWHLFATNVQPSPPVEVVTSAPVVAWLPARFRNRSPGDFDFFNLGEMLAFEGRPDICALWALSDGADAWGAMSQLPKVITVIDPAAVPDSGLDAWLDNLALRGGRLNVLLLDDNSKLAGRIDELRHNFGAYERLMVSDFVNPADLTERVAERIIRWQDQPHLPMTAEGGKLWRTSVTYFPAWKTSSGDAVWLTGQGGMAMFATDRPSLRWTKSPWQFAGALMSVLGLICALFTSRGGKSLSPSGMSGTSCSSQPASAEPPHRSPLPPGRITSCWE